MSDLSNGILVQHVSLGVGKIVALEPFAAHVFFPAAEKRFATKLRLPDALSLLRTEGVVPDAWLQGLSAFTLDPETRRYALAASWLTHEQAIAQFVAAFPQGFADPRHAGPAVGSGKGGRAPRWRAAHEAWGRAFGEGEGDRLVAAGDVRELVKRTLAVERHVLPLHPPDEAGALAEALADPSATELFFQRLFELLSVPSPSRARFDRLFAAAAALAGSPESAWAVATILPFVAQPERQVFLRPATACDVAKRLGCDLRWDDAPNWATYAAFRGLSAKLLEELRPIGARDHVDVETFLHATATARAKPRAKGAGARPADRRKAGGAVRERHPQPVPQRRRAR
jgi:hypothetical protein